VEYIPLFNATSWGQSEHGLLGSSIQVSTIENIDRQYCNRRFKTSDDVSQICAGRPSNPTCVGSSGGPLSAELNYGGVSRVFQYGVISNTSLSCGSLANYPNITYFTNWILDVVIHFEN